MTTSSSWLTQEEMVGVQQIIADSHIDLRKRHNSPEDPDFPASPPRTMDLNDRGRGRTVETQAGGVAVLRAMWEFMRMYAD